MRYRYCGGTTIKDSKTDGWAHDCQSFADRLNEQQEKLERCREAIEVMIPLCEECLDDEEDLAYMKEIKEIFGEE